MQIKIARNYFLPSQMCLCVSMYLSYCLGWSAEVKLPHTVGVKFGAAFLSSSLNTNQSLQSCLYLTDSNISLLKVIRMVMTFVKNCLLQCYL